MTISSDSEAVRACRQDMVARGVTGGRDWRNTVVDRDGGGWVVRIWTRIPPRVPRPVGPPDFVYEVAAAATGGPQVHLAWSAA